MALISRSARGAVRNASRSRETVRIGASANRNRRQKPKGKSFSLSFKDVGPVFGWLGTVCLGLAVVGFLSIGLLYGYRYLTNSSYFAVKTLEVVGNFRLTSREVLDNADVDKGMNALLVSIDAVERKLAGNPWVEAVSVKRTLPDGITIRLKEKTPHFWVRHNGVFYYADATGVPIVAVTPDSFASFPVLEVEGGAEDMTAKLPELLASLAKARLTVDVAAVSRVRLSPGRGVEVFLENNRLVLSIGQEEWTANLGRLAATLADVAKRGEMKDIREVRVHGAGVWVIKKGPVV
ncbi:FtsQ-type POTRA domain-containing protein [Desulfovibrio sp. OttesenSCG-928-O18]|nr:FtsQ-type POTRA domain-containing protein [Desulfovibrio sp. OttesenSCG-928-O18]